MSIKKYDIAKEFKRGIIARIEYRACEWKKESMWFEAGWSWAHKHLIGLIHDGVNEYLESVGESAMGLIPVQSPNVRLTCTER